MARQSFVATYGNGVNSDLTPSAKNSIDKYYATDAASNAAQATANTALANANNAQTTADTAAANAINAQTTANDALYTANQASGILAGSSNFYGGDFAIATNTAPTILKTATNVTSEGITLNATTGVMNFSYLGDYIVTVDPHGDFTNSRNDWYQNFSIELKELNSGKVYLIFHKLIPPQYTIGIQSQLGVGVIRVNLGDLWVIQYHNVVNGTLSNNPGIRVEVRKVV